MAQSTANFYYVDLEFIGLFSYQDRIVIRHKTKMDRCQAAVIII